MKRTATWTAGAIILGSLLAYGSTLRYGYVQDAGPAVSRNSVVRQGSLAEILTSDYWKGTGLPSRTLYRPVTILSFALEARVAGNPEPTLSHAGNLLLHVATALMLFFYARRLGAGDGACAAAAILFAVHPLLLQGVVNVVGRADVLATLFSLAALWVLSLAGRWKNGPYPAPGVHRATAWCGGALLLFALGSKESAVSAAVLILAQEAVYRFPERERGSPWWVRRVASLSPCGLAVFVFVLLRTRAIGMFPGLQEVRAMDNVLVGVDGLPRIATTLAMATRYGKLLLFPWRLSADYSGTVIARETSLFAPLPLAGFVVLAGLLTFALAPLLWRRANAGLQVPRVLSMGALLFLLPYVTVGNILTLNGAGFAERLMYFPAAGFCLLAGVLAQWVHTRVKTRGGLLAGRILLAVYALLALAGALAAREQSRMWRSDEALMEHSLRSTPRSLRALYSLAAIRLAQGRKDEALELHRAAVGYSPEHGASWLDIGILLGERGDLAGAEAALRRSLEIRSDIGETQMYMGIVLSRTGRLRSAERALRKALLLQPSLVKAGAQLAHVLFREGRYSEAAVYYRRCIDLGRSDLLPYLERSEALAGK